jgi:hypothetical protein
LQDPRAAEPFEQWQDYHAAASALDDFGPYDLVAVAAALMLAACAVLSRRQR